MGCDIHLFIEYNIPTGVSSSGLENEEVWTSLTREEINIERNYALFFALASVRPNDDLPKNINLQPKGLPCNLSSRVSEAFEADKAAFNPHGASHISSQELRDIIRDTSVREGTNLSYCDTNMCYIFRRGLNAILNLVSGLEDTWGSKKARAVFWFDN